MNHDSKKLSRRDWFRLRIPHQNQMLSGPSTKTETETLTPIEHPPNHDGLDMSELPPMREATLSREQVVALFSDIENLATDILLMQRSTGETRASASKADTASKLEMAKTALLSGGVERVQVRYRWQDSLWIDTLKTGLDGFHIVRIAHASG